jgi:hypothetical protein
LARTTFAQGREHTGDRQTDAIWTALNSLADALSGSPFVRGRLLTEEEGAPPGSGLAFVSGTARSLPHGLGRRARGFLELYPAAVQSAARVGLYSRTAPAGVSVDTHVTLRPTSTGTCWIWVF